MGVPELEVSGVEVVKDEVDSDNEDVAVKVWIGTKSGVCKTKEKRSELEF